MESGDRFDQYEILRHADGSPWKLGSGAMGVTYVALDTELQRRVVLKVIHPGILGKEEVLERFQREARAAAALRHPNIANVYRLGRSADGTDYYAMEFCEGATLQDAIHAHGALPADQALRLTQQVAKALIVAGEQRVVHRDLKPSNLILTERSDEGVVVKVIDFGLAKTVADGPAGFISQGSGFSGTLQYASPEQLEEGPVDHRADIYALGGCLWFMLTGHPPFEGSLAVVIKQKMTTDLAWQRLSHVPQPVHGLLRRMMARDPAQRHENAVELRKDIDRCLAEIVSGPAGPPPLPGQPAAGEDPASTASVAAPPYAERFQIGEVLWQDGMGTVFRATDAADPAARVALRQIDCSLTAVPMVRRTLEERLGRAQHRLQQNLLLVRDFGLRDGQLGFAFPWTDGFSLRQLLANVDVLSPKDVLRLLRPLAAASDFAAQHRLEGFDLAPEQILLHFPAALRADQKAGCLASPLADWPVFELNTSCLTGGLFAPVGSASIGPGSGGLSIASSQNVTAGNGGPAPLAKFAAELLGCRVGRDGKWERGNVLDAASFDVLCQGMDAGGTARFATCAAFVRAFETARSQSAAPSSPLPPPPPLAPLPAASSPPPAAAPSRSAAKGAWIAAAITALLAAGSGGYYYFGVQLPAQREKNRPVAKSEPAEPSKPPEPQTQPEKDPDPEPTPPDPMPEPNPTEKPTVADAPETKPTPDPMPVDEPPPPPPPDPKKLVREKEDAVRKQLNDLYPKNDYEAGFAILKESAELFPNHPEWDKLADTLADLAVQAMQKGARLGTDMKAHAAFWAERKVPAAMELQGLVLASNKDGPDSLAAAYQNFAAAAAAGRKHSRFLQAECLYHGKGTEKNVAEAKKLLELCVGDHNLAAISKLGHILHQEGGDANFRRAAELFQTAADAGFAEAMRNLGVLYMNGQGVKQEAKVGADLFRQAAEKGDVDAMINYARCLEKGIGVAKSAAEAQSWRQKASQMVNTEPPADSR